MVFLTTVALIFGGLGLLVPLKIAESIIGSATSLFALLVTFSGVLFYTLRSTDILDSDIFTRREREGVRIKLKSIRRRSATSLTFSFIAGLVLYLLKAMSLQLDSQVLFVILMMISALLITLQLNTLHHYMHIQDFKEFVKNREKSAEKRRNLLKEISGD